MHSATCNTQLGFKRGEICNCHGTTQPDGNDMLQRILKHLESDRITCEDHIYVTGNGCEACAEEWAQQVAIDNVRLLIEG